MRLKAAGCHREKVVQEVELLHVHVHALLTDAVLLQGFQVLEQYPAPSKRVPIMLMMRLFDSPTLRYTCGACARIERLLWLLLGRTDRTQAGSLSHKEPSLSFAKTP